MTSSLRPEAKGVEFFIAATDSKIAVRARQGTRAFPPEVDLSDLHIFAASDKVRKPLDGRERIRKRKFEGSRWNFSWKRDKENTAGRPKCKRNCKDFKN